MNRATVFYQAFFEKTLEVMKDPTESSVQMKAFPTDMAAYGVGGALVQRKGSNPGIGGTAVYFGVEDCSIEESQFNEAGGQVIRAKMSIGEFG